MTSEQAEDTAALRRKLLGILPLGRAAAQIVLGIDEVAMAALLKRLTLRGEVAQRRCSLTAWTIIVDRRSLTQDVGAEVAKQRRRDAAEDRRAA